MSLQCHALPCAKDRQIHRPFGEPYTLSRELAMRAYQKPKVVFASSSLEAPRERIAKGDFRKVNILLTQVDCNFHRLTEEQTRELRELGRVTEEGFAIDTIHLPLFSLSKEQVDKLISLFPETRKFSCKSVSDVSLKLFQNFKKLQTLSILESESVISAKGIESLVGLKLKKLELSRCAFAVDLLKQFPDLEEVNLNFKGGGMPDHAITKLFREHKKILRFNGKVREEVLRAEGQQEMQQTQANLERLKKELQELAQDKPQEENKKKNKQGQKGLSFINDPEVPQNVRDLRRSIDAHVKQAKRVAKTAAERRAVRQREKMLEVGDKFWQACSQATSAAKRAKIDDSKESTDSLVQLFDALRLSSLDLQSATKDQD